VAENGAQETQTSATDRDRTAIHNAERAGKTTRAAAPGRESKAPRSAETSGEKSSTRAADKGTATPSNQTRAARNSTRPKEIGAASAVVRTSRGGTNRRVELKPLGINVEAVPFVVLAAASSIALALGVWVRPRMVLLLLGIAGTMLAFALLDIREVSHQSDEARTGLAVLAAAIAAMHLAAAIVASVMARGAAQS
jgi:hypothetical protein